MKYNCCFVKYIEFPYVFKKDTFVLKDLVTVYDVFCY